MAGTIAAIDNSYGMVGIAPATKIIPIKSLGDNGSGSMRDVANGVIWAVDNAAYNNNVLRFSLSFKSYLNKMH